MGPRTMDNDGTMDDVSRLLVESRELYVENAKLARHNKELMRLHAEMMEQVESLVKINEMQQRTIGSLIESLGNVLEKKAEDITEVKR